MVKPKENVKVIFKKYLEELSQIRIHYEFRKIYSHKKESILVNERKYRQNHKEKFREYRCAYEKTPRQQIQETKRAYYRCKYEEHQEPRKNIIPK